MSTWVGIGNVVALAFLLPIATEFAPARFENGALPVQPIRTQAQGEVLLEVLVSPSGDVSDVKTLRSTPPFTEAMVKAVRTWRFAPARAEEGETEKTEVSVESSVLVAGIFRAPALYQGTSAGEPPADVAVPSSEVAFPVGMITPAYPPDALSNGVVMVEVSVGEDGSVHDATVIRSAPGFDDVALDAARRWRFRPAVWEGRSIGQYAYTLFGFKEPITEP